MKRRVVPCIRTLCPGSPDELVPRQSSNQQLKGSQAGEQMAWQLSMAIRSETPHPCRAVAKLVWTARMQV